MRGKGFASGLRAAACGITPAYAGKRKMIDEIWQCKRDHPRVCGEKIYVDEVLPADTWITPAYAGKRNRRFSQCWRGLDHPRVCGEKLSIWARGSVRRGSPPRMRGKGAPRGLRSDAARITPAYAGKRHGVRFCWHPWRDHPRVCGEKRLCFRLFFFVWGSPPRMRGKGSFPPFALGQIGITPAYAGKRLKRSRSTVPPVAIVPLFPSVCNKPVVSDGSPAVRDAPLFLPAENAVPASPACNLRSL